MQLFHGSAGLSATFDETNLVSAAGLVPAVAVKTGIGVLTDHCAQQVPAPVRGVTFTYVIAAFAAVYESLRKLLSFLKERLAVHRVTRNNADVPTVFWEPEAHVDEIPPTIRC